MYPEFPSAPNDRHYYRVDCTLCKKTNMSALTYEQQLRTELHTKMYALHEGEKPDFLKMNLHKFTRSRQEHDKKRRYEEEKAATKRKRKGDGDGDRRTSTPNGDADESVESLVATPSPREPREEQLAPPPPKRHKHHKKKH